MVNGSSRIVVAVFAAVAFAFLLAGCTTSKYVPCCMRSGIYNATDKAFLDSFNCVYPNGSTYGGCDKPSTMLLYPNGTANCSDGSICASILYQDDCDRTSTCHWDDSLSPGSKCQGGTAYKLMPICVDDVPTNCINNKCTAMVCGFTHVAPAPPPSSVDWSNVTENNYPATELSNLPSINLQSTSCTFDNMNRKLYNKIRQSKGSLWVNSFRFGVGESFSDYELSKYFFPATDRLCAINPLGSIDRFSAYLNEPESWCQKSFAPYYHCTKNDLNFTSREVCVVNCEGDISDCAVVTSASAQYVCAQTNFTYSDQTMCKATCSVLDDPTYCTFSQDAAPFLQSDGRYKAKYVADYLTDSSQVISGGDGAFEQTCRLGGWYDGWDPHTAFWCDDFGYPNRAMVTGPWAHRGDDSEFRGYVEDRKSTAVDFDYQYYADKLKKQYLDAGADINKPFPFECRSASECLSGSCDLTYYHRALCKDFKDLSDPPNNIYCAAHVERRGQNQKLTLIGEEPHSPALYAELSDTFNGFHKVSQISDEFFTADQQYSSTDTKVNFRLYSDGEIAILDKCGVAPTSTVPKCIFLNSTNTSYGGSYYVIDSAWVIDDSCPAGSGYSVENYNYYDVEFNTSTGNLGNCKLLDSRTEAPYLDIETLGWCAGCTFSTMAVQKIDWSGSPGGEGFPGTKDYACYEWHAEMDYSVSDGPSNSYTSASVAPVRKSKSGSAFDGNIGRSEAGFPLIGSDWANFGCYDEWRGLGGTGYWWQPYNSQQQTPIPYPSAPYLRDKLTSYLQSNVMPILDERSAKTGVWWDYNTLKAECDQVSPPYWCGVNGGIAYATDTCEWACSSGSSCQSAADTYQCSSILASEDGELYADLPDCRSSCTYGTCTAIGYTSEMCNTNGKLYPIGYCYWNCKDTHYYSPASTNYQPIEVCRNYGGDGAAVHVVADTDLIADPGANGDAYLPLGVGENSLIVSYLGLSGATDGGIYHDLSGTDAAVVRANELKKRCFNAPLMGLAIKSTESLTSLIGPDKDNPGKLHRFFYKPGYDEQFTGGGGTYAQMVARGTPNKYADAVDLLMQEWYPACNSGGADLYGKTVAEVEGRMNFSRALLSNFSKPSIIWKFHFPDSNNCYQMVGGKKDYSLFLSYLFNHTADLVDAGIMGIIYDSWMTDSGRGYGEPSNSYVGYTGLSTTTAVGLLDDPAAGKQNTPFCELQRYSQKVMGVTKYTYGQKLYATEGECACQQCTESDYSMGLCDRNALNDVNIEQLYCNGGGRCDMPDDRTDYKNFKCPSTCISNDDCVLCTSSSGQSFCSIQETGSSPQGYYKNYNEIGDTDWVFVAGLPPKDKCCLEKTDADGLQTEYTYAARSGTKQRSEFLQYPTRGDIGIDCGKTPDTSILTYCNVQIPISQFEAKCFRSR